MLDVKEHVESQGVIQETTEESNGSCATTTDNLIRYTEQGIDIDIMLSILVQVTGRDPEDIGDIKAWGKGYDDGVCEHHTLNPYDKTENPIAFESYNLGHKDGTKATDKAWLQGCNDGKADRFYYNPFEPFHLSTAQAYINGYEDGIKARKRLAKARREKMAKTKREKAWHKGYDDGYIGRPYDNPFEGTPFAQAYKDGYDAGVDDDYFDYVYLMSF
jgi:ribosome modulation factor